MKQLIRMAAMALVLASASAWTIAEPAAVSLKEGFATFLKKAKVAPENTSYLDHNKQPISKDAFLKEIDAGYKFEVKWSTEHPVLELVATLDEPPAVVQSPESFMADVIKGLDLKLGKAVYLDHNKRPITEAAFREAIKNKTPYTAETKVSSQSEVAVPLYTLTAAPKKPKN
ncbi:MAG: hypothetical protein V4631_16430 [Pseudomonadota bacterium]